MIKQIIFDLDGVLIDFCDTHFECFAQALYEVAGKVISKPIHDEELNGLPTKVKLEKLGITDKQYVEDIFDRKQALTQIAINKLTRDHDLIHTLNELSRKGIKLYCASNSIKSTILKVLDRLGISSFIESAISNDSISPQHAKPFPYRYWACMISSTIGPAETLIIEDSEVGLKGARVSGANVMAVKDRSEVTLENIREEMKKYDIPANINVLIPAAGAGARFVKAGYDRPKPFILVDGKQMMSHVIESIGLEGYGIHYHFILQNTADASTFSNVWHHGHRIIYTDKVTEGAACTTLIAKDYINNDFPLLICNSDQIFKWDKEAFFNQMQRGNYDAGILVFNAKETKWSYAKVDSRDRMTVVQVAEKLPISDLATVGAYYWKRGSDYVKYAEQMIEKNIRTNNEFYVCPVFNEAIQDNRRVLAFKVDEMWGLGTPEDLDLYLEHLEGERCG